MSTTAETQNPAVNAAVIASDVQVTPVTTAADRKAFILFQYELYKDQPNFVPPLVMDREQVLDPKKNPWFEFGSAQLYLARRAGKIVGRIAAVGRWAWEPHARR